MSLLSMFSVYFQEYLSQSMLDVSAESAWFESVKRDNTVINAAISDVIGDILGLQCDPTTPPEAPADLDTTPEPLTLSMLGVSQQQEEPSLLCFRTKSRTSSRGRSDDSGISSQGSSHSHKNKSHRRSLARKLKHIGRQIHHGSCDGMDLKTLAVLWNSQDIPSGLK